MEAAEPTPDLPLGMCQAYPGMPGQTPLDWDALLEPLSIKDLQVLAERNPDDALRTVFTLQEAHSVTGIAPPTALQWGIPVGQSFIKSSDEIRDDAARAASSLLEKRWEAKFEGARKLVARYVKGALAHPENGTIESGRWTIAVPRGNDLETRHMKFLVKDHKHFLVLGDVTAKTMEDFPTLKVVHNDDEFAKIAKELQPSLGDRLKEFSHKIEKVSKTYKKVMEFFDTGKEAWEKIPEKLRGPIKTAAAAAFLAVCSGFEGSQIGHQTQAVLGPVLNIVMPHVPPGAVDSIGLQEPASPRLVAQVRSSSVRRS